MEHQAISSDTLFAERGSVALMVDGDNMSAEQAGRLLTKAGGLGRVIVKRVYAAAAHLKGWEKSYGFSLRYAQGAKNATDLLMTIEAVELGHRGDLKSFVLVSSDRDFAPLARWLVERGHFVLGVGGALAPKDWQKSCTRFEILEEPSPLTPAGSEQPAPAQGQARSEKASGAGTLADPTLPRPWSRTDAAIREVIGAEGQGGSMEIGRLGITMGSLRKITLATVQATSWRAYLATRPDLYHLDPKGPRARVKWLGS